MLLPIVDPCQGLLLPLLTTIHNQILLIIFFSSKKQWIFLSPYCSYQPDWLWQSLWADSTVIPSTTSPVVLHLPWLKLYNPKWSLKPLLWSILTPHYSPWWKWELSSLSMTSVPLADFSPQQREIIMLVDGSCWLWSWCSHLPWIEYCYNSFTSSATGTVFNPSLHLPQSGDLEDHPFWLSLWDSHFFSIHWSFFQKKHQPFCHSAQAPCKFIPLSMSPLWNLLSDCITTKPVNLL